MLCAVQIDVFTLLFLLFSRPSNRQHLFSDDCLRIAGKITRTVLGAVYCVLHCAVLFHAVRCNITGRECLYTDGGILDQYPIHCFDRTYLSVHPVCSVFVEISKLSLSFVRARVSRVPIFRQKGQRSRSPDVKNYGKLTSCLLTGVRSGAGGSGADCKLGLRHC